MEGNLSTLGIYCVDLEVGTDCCRMAWCSWQYQFRGDMRALALSFTGSAGQNYVSGLAVPTML